ncbi:MAG TPA: hypothetical protein VF286_02360 [Acidiphilium sp.]
MAQKRNPMARDLLTNPLYRAKRTKSRAERAQKLDRWDRRAKHKQSVRSPESKPGSGDFFALAIFLRHPDIGTLITHNTGRFP